MDHVIIGTAGHIDHGKTELIRALTGRNTDRLKEEMERGISIDLGFTYFDLPSGRQAGIIDVPGHEKFVKNMLAGVIGMDIILLVIAADEGIMPQTKEHVNILSFANKKKGIVVLTKCDLVDDEFLQLVRSECQEYFNDTFLNDTPIVEVSSKTREGIDKLVSIIDASTNELKIDNNENPFRMPIDRVFTIKGIGTVVTGTIIEGKVNKGDIISVFPIEESSKVRSIQVHEKDVEFAEAGQRAAINLSQIKSNQINRGDILSQKDNLKTTMMLDGKLSLLKNSPFSLKNRTRIRLNVGTKELFSRVVLLDCDIIKPGEGCFVQFRLEEATAVKQDDFFIVRFYSPMITIGGGKILDEFPKKHKRYVDDIIKSLMLIDEGNPIEKVIHQLVSKEFFTQEELNNNFNLSKEVILQLVDNNTIILFENNNRIFYSHKLIYEKIKNIILQELSKYHKNNPLNFGIDKEELKSSNKQLIFVSKNYTDLIIDKLLKNKEIKSRGNIISLADFNVSLTNYQQNISNNIEEYFKKESLKGANIHDLLDGKKNKEKDIYNKLFHLLCKNKTLIVINDNIIMHSEIYDFCIKVLVEYLNNKDSIDAKTYRDLLNTSRKYAIALLEYFDREKITKRVEDIRILNRKDVDI